MTPGPRLEHDALLFDDDDAFVSALAPWLREGLERGAPAAVATTPAHIEGLRDALGREAERVWFSTSEEWYRRPVSTVAGWDRLVREAGADQDAPMRIVGEVRFGSTPEEHAAWTRYESAINRAFRDAPAWVVCPYDTARLSAKVVRDARRTHPTVWDPFRGPSPDYLEPAQLFAMVPERLPVPEFRPIFQLAEPMEIAGPREAVRRAALGAGFSPERAEDLVTAFAEVAANAIRHGGGIARAALWVLGDEIVCEVRDAGSRPADPASGYVPPAPFASGGMGLWIARQLTDRLVIEADRGGGTAVRFAVRRSG